MRQLFVNHFYELYFDDTLRLFKMVWLATTENMKPNDFKEGLLKYVSYYDELKPYGVLHDMRKNAFTVSTDLQDWANENINRRAFEVGLKKVAFVFNDDIFTQVSVQQTMEEKEGAKLISGYFDSLENAWEWLSER